MVWQGKRYDIGAAAFAPMRDYSSKGGPALPAGTACGPCPFSIGDGDQSIDSENESFVIPLFGYNWMIDDNRSLGISVYGNGGMNTEYKGGTRRQRFRAAVGNRLRKILRRQGFERSIEAIIARAAPVVSVASNRASLSSCRSRL